MKRGKRYIEAAKLVDPQAVYDANEALELVVKAATAKFDETVEVHMKMGVD
ncbi:MAG TPA: 50S ribosomal protein L1, partial [Clostridia bacterium]|nr:50S ribosomal protein L1 [Clostridia bacterium]